MVVANNRPPVINVASAHRPGTAGPARARTAACAHPNASNTARPGSTTTRGAKPASTTTTAPNAAAHIAARDLNRRTQSRTVVCGTATPAATGRTPERPATTDAIDSPITATTSSRPRNKNDGNKAWLTPQPRHSPRRTHTRTQRPSSKRTDRS